MFLGIPARFVFAAFGLLLSAGVGRGTEVLVEGLSMPFFDEAGVLTHTLTAKRGISTGALRRLEEVEVRYVADGDPHHVVQRLTTEVATWNEKAATLTGDGPVAVHTETENLSGVGFDFALATSVLHIQRDVRLANPDFVLTGDRGEADLVIEKQGKQVKYRDLRRCTVSGNLHLVATHPGNSKFPFDEAFTDLAIYTDATRTIEMPHTVRARRGQSENVTKSAVIRLGDDVTAK